MRFSIKIRTRTVGGVFVFGRFHFSSGYMFSAIFLIAIAVLNCNGNDASEEMTTVGCLIESSEKNSQAMSFTLDNGWTLRNLDFTQWKHRECLFLNKQADSLSATVMVCDAKRVLGKDDLDHYFVTTLLPNTTLLPKDTDLTLHHISTDKELGVFCIYPNPLLAVPDQSVPKQQMSLLFSKGDVYLICAIITGDSITQKNIEDFLKILRSSKIMEKNSVQFLELTKDDANKPDSNNQYGRLEQIQEECRITSCSSNLKQIGLAIEMYSIDNKKQFPDKSGAEGLEMLRAGGYLEDTKTYTCPSTTTVARDGVKLTEENVDYVYIGGLTKSNSGSALAYDKPNNHDKYGNILFVDGHVKGYAGVDWMDNIKNKK